MVELILHVYKNDEICVGALQKAARVGNTGIVKLLLSTRAGAAMSVGAGELKAAAGSGNIKIFRLFYELYNQSRKSQSFDGIDALRSAVCGGHTAIVKLLLKNGTSPASEDSLCDAIGTGRIELVRILLEHGAGVRDTLLEVATHRSNVGIVRLLLSQKLVDVQFTRLGGYKFTPLQAACKGGHNEIVKLLLENGPIEQRY
jgi:ankyrin repeat protein